MMVVVLMISCNCGVVWGGFLDLMLFRLVDVDYFSAIDSFLRRVT